MAPKPVVCPSCGFKNNAPNATRCSSCGAKMDDVGVRKRTREEELERRYQQEGINMTWLVIAFVVQGVLTAAIVFGLPLIVRSNDNPVLDFEGGNGMAICIPVWFVGGLLIGMISPGRTFLEPVLAALLVAVPTTVVLHHYQTVRTMPLFLYGVMAAIGVLFTLIGSYIGERIQLGPPPKTVE
jgi:hypothetical protein